MTIEYLDRPAPGWFVLSVMRAKSRGWDWVALMVDFDPDEYCPGGRTVQQWWLRIPGKHRNGDSADRALKAMMLVRH